MDKIWLIIKREYLTRVKKKSFLVMTILGPLLMASLMFVVFWLGIQENNNHKVLVIDGNLGVLAEAKSSPSINFDYQNDMTLEQAKKLFHESTYTCLLHIQPNVTKANSATLYFKKQPSALAIRSMERQMEEVIEELKLEINNINKKDYYGVKTAITLQTIKFKAPGIEEEVNQDQAWVGFAFGLMIYMFIFMYGVQVMRGVIEEKSNRIIEVIISSVKPFQLMLGKILGVAFVGFTQFALWVILTMILFTTLQTVFFEDLYDPSVLVEMQMTPEILEQVKAENSLNNINIYDPNNILNRINFPLMLSMFAFYFLGGYLLYSALFAAVGSAVDSETDTQQFMIPVTIPLIFAYMISVFIAKNPDGPAAFWFSIIPLTSPIVMMVRLAVGVGDGGIPIWEIALSMLFLIGGFIFTTWIAARIYRTGILMYGKKVTYKELWKWLTYKQ
jgi:ABC-2 type transport system permease protein